MAKKIASLYAEIGADTTKLQQGLDDTKGRLTTFKEGLGNITRTIAGVTGAAAVMGATMQQIFAFGKAGAELEYAQGKFDNLAASIGTTSDALKNDLRGATKGLVADSELVASAGDFMALGLAKTHDEVVRLTRVAGALGMDMNQLVLTLTNQPGVKVAGHIYGINQYFNNGTKAVAAHVRLEPSKGLHLFDGMYVQGSIATGRQLCNALPSKAIVTADGKNYVFLLNDAPKGGKYSFSRHEVSTGVSQDGYTEISLCKHMTKGKKVVTDNAFYLASMTGEHGEHNH